MKEFFKSKTGQIVCTSLNTAIILAICTPLFDLIFSGGIKEFSVYRYVIEPIVVGVLVGLFTYLLQRGDESKNKK